MDLVKLIRLDETPNGTFGILVADGLRFLSTLERPWADNKENTSCIPVGDYVCAMTKSPKFGDTYEVLDVPGRTNILFHSGNKVTDTQGCILIGLYINPEKTALFDSKLGLYQFLRWADRKNFKLQISKVE